MNRDTSATIEGAVATAGEPTSVSCSLEWPRGTVPPAGASLVRRYDRLIAVAACRMLFSPADVDDVVQETFLILLVSADSIRDPYRLGPWLWTTARATWPAAPPAATSAAGPSRTSRPACPLPERDASDEVEWALERREQCVALREAMASITSRSAT